MHGRAQPPPWVDLRLVESTLHEGLWVIDADSRTVYANEPMAAMLGYTVDELMGRSMFDFAAPGWVETAHANIRQRRAGVADEHLFEYQRADGRPLWARLSAAPARAPDGTYLGAIALVVDLTAQRDAERARRQSEARLETVFRSLPFDCWVTDTEGRCVLQNPTSIAHWGDHVGRIPEPGSTPEELRALWLAANARALAGETVRERRDIVTSDGRRVFDAVVAPVRDGDEIQGVLGVNIDVTEQVQLERRLREAETLEAIGRLAGGIAHDFNNVLTAILGLCTVLERRIAAPRDRQDLRTIREGAERAADLTRQLLTFARRESVAPQLVRPGEVVARIGTLLDRVLGDDVELTIDVGDARAPILVDPVGLERAIVNLAVNARDAMPGGGRLAIRVAERTVTAPTHAADTEITPGDYVVLTVEDTGVGMDAATAAHIFEPFFTTRDQGGGSGLGLASVHGFVRQAGGHVVVETAPGQGARFDLYLRRADGEVAPVPAAPPAVTAATRSARILVAEDEPRVRALICRVLREDGYDVHEAASPSEALGAVGQNGPFDLIISDVSMPEGGGVALVDRLDQAGLGMPVLFMSGYTSSPDLGDRMATPRFRFLAKPFLPDALLTLVRELLGP